MLGYDLKPMFSLQRSLPPWLRHKPKLLNTFYGGLALISALVLLRIAATSFSSTSSSSPFDFSGADPHVSSSEWTSRAERVKQAFLHSYHGYEKYALPQDELRPVTNEGMSGYNGWGVTAFDSLDTMLLMGLQDEYKRALKVVEAADFTISKQPMGQVPYFETIIRYLGGLLSAYALSNDTILLRRAENLADALDPVFDTPSGLAAFAVNPITRKQHKVGSSILAEFASFQVEYTYLAKASGKKKYMDRVHKLNEIFRKTNLNGSGGMLPTVWDAAGRPSDSRNKVSVGAQADSTHEYLLKQFLLTGKTDKLNLELYLKATTYILTNLLYLSPNRSLLYVTDTTVPLWTDSLSGSPSHIFEHLSCFFPGLLALGAHTLPLSDLSSLGVHLDTLFPPGSGTAEMYDTLKKYDLKQLHLWAAEGLAQTCWLTYADQPSGLGPDEVIMLAPSSSREWDEDLERWRQTGHSYLWIDALDKWKMIAGKGGRRGGVPPGVEDKKPVVWTEEDRVAKRPNGRDYHVRKTGYLLRPETIESFYLLWRVTGDVKWRNRGWKVFEAIEREAKTDSGYVTLKNVKTSPAERGNSMPSFFLAETLKYLYLLFREDDPLPLDRIPALKRAMATASSTLKQGEFVGALDCGTTSVRFIVFNKFADIIAQHQLEFPQYYPHPGWHEHDANEIQQTSDQCIEGAVKALEDAGWSKDSIKVIGITNQRETAVAWSRRTGKPLCKAIVWTDSRTKNTVAHYEHKLQTTGLQMKPGVFRLGQDGVDALRELTGLPLSTYFSAIKVRWMIDHYPEVAKAHEEDDLLFGTVESWVAYNLLGGVEKNIHIAEVTNASRTLLLNSTTLQWDPRLLDFFELRQSILPRIVSTSEVYGNIENGPLSGVPIGGLVGDQQGALIGNKCLKQGEAKCTYGTGAFLLFCTGNEIVQSNHGLISTVAYQAGPDAKPVYALEGSIAVAGSAIKWLRDSMSLISSASEVNVLASKEKDTGGLYFVTAFSGLLAPYWDSGAAGTLIGISQYTNPSHIARATLEANAFQTRAIIESMKLDSGVDLKNLKVDGGMTNGDLAMEILANIGGFNVVRPEMRESTALGAAICAGSAVKLFGWDLARPETLKGVNDHANTVFEPKTDEGERAKRWEGWQRAVERSRGWDEGVDGK